MTAQFVVELARDTVYTAIMVAGPIMIVAFDVGIVISLVQAVMQMQEMTLAYVPKLVAIGFSLIIFGNWMLRHLAAYSERLLGGFDRLI